MSNLLNYVKKVNAYKVVSLIMILSLLVNMAYFAKTDFLNFSLDSWGYSEFMISFSGGFVRRGLFGQLLIWFTTVTGLSPAYIIIPISLAAYTFVLYFFCKIFRKKGYNWWILLSPLMCGFVIYIIRKDYLLYCVMIGMLYLVRDGQPNITKRLLATSLAVLGLFLHEAFIFWGIPIFALVLLTQKKQLKINSLFILVILIVFLIQCMYHGDESYATTIFSTWNNILPDNPLSYDLQNNSIGALAWGTSDTIIHHLDQNTGGAPAGYTGALYWPIFYCVVYYFISFFFVAFQPKKENFDKTSQTQLSYLFILVSVCLLPMYAGLSCDFGRLFQYAVIGSFAGFFILNENVRARLMTYKIQSDIQSFNNVLGCMYVPKRAMLVTLLLLIGVSPCYYDLYSSISMSPIGSLFKTLNTIAINL